MFIVSQSSILTNDTFIYSFLWYNSKIKKHIDENPKDQNLILLDCYGIPNFFEVRIGHCKGLSHFY